MNLVKVTARDIVCVAKIIKRTSSFVFFYLYLPPILQMLTSLEFSNIDKAHANE